MSSIPRVYGAGVLALLVLLASCGESTPASNAATDKTQTPTHEAAGHLTDASYAAYRDAIGPQARDQAWQKIDWLPSYRAGLQAASTQQKPILLWVMNGHPLGCT